MPTFPFIGKVLSHEPGRRLVALREIRLNEDRFLRDHTLGRDVSTLDPGLAGLPVMPLTMSMEMLAEAATALVPGRRLIGMRDVRAYRWMAIEGETLTVRLVATAQGNEGREVAVQAFEGEAPAGGPPPTPLVEGTMLLAEAYPAPPAAGTFALADERPSRFSPGDLYREVMFHGPAFRGVANLDRWGRDGATATLRTLPADGLFASTRQPAFVTDPVLMDQPGQVVGMWTADHLDRGFVVFPFHLEALHLFAPPPPAGRTLQCQARIALVGEQQVRSDLDVVDGERVIARLAGWWDRRFDLPSEFVRFLYTPSSAALGRPWPAPLAGWSGAEAFEAWRLGTDDFPENFLTSHGGVWQRALARAVLGRQERERWQALRVPEPRRVEWLLGRVVAKAALRAWLEKHHGLKLAPADLEILPDANGRPVPSGAWTRGLPHVPVLSLAHANGIAVAVAGPGEAAAGVGVDLEHAAQVSDDAGRVAFSDDERALLAAAGGDEWPLRLWCAKEAAAKALGLGLAGGPRALVATALDAAAGTVTLRVAGEVAERLPAADGRTVVSHTARERDLVVASSLYIPQ
jgi:4'-phosphopantetheinyl transferase EntD